MANRLSKPKVGACKPAMMTREQVAEIRLSGESAWAYAKRHGLSYNVVYNAAHGVSWKAKSFPGLPPARGMSGTKFGGRPSKKPVHAVNVSHKPEPTEDDRKALAAWDAYVAERKARPPAREGPK